MKGIVREGVKLETRRSTGSDYAVWKKGVQCIRDGAADVGAVIFTPHAETAGSVRASGEPFAVGAVKADTTTHGLSVVLGVNGTAAQPPQHARLI